MRKSINIFLCFFILFFIILACDDIASAQSSTASVKGINTTNLNYKSDNYNFKTIETSKYKYGSMSMWAANYEYVFNESDGSKTLYIIYFVESTIDSVGKNKTNYFRNKELTIETNFTSTNPSILVNDTDSTTNSQTSFSTSFGVDGKIEIGKNPNVSTGASFSMTNTQTYDTINLSKQVINEDKKSVKKEYKFSFLNYKNGKMVSPNIGEVKERLYFIYGIYNYDANTSYSMDIKTTAYIFKDATWPKSNYTLDGSINFKFINGQAV